MKRVVIENGNQTAGEDSSSQSKGVSPSPSSTSQSHGELQRRNVLPPEILEILVPSVEVGVASGMLGLFAGAVGGIVRSSTPSIFSLASGIQWFSLGSSYYASRAVIEKAWGGHDQLTKRDRIQASAMAGGFAGMIGGLIRGPRNVAPGVMVFSLLGAGGQAAANSMAGYSWKSTRTSFLSSKYSPVTPLSDPEYERFLEEKLLKVEAEISILDDNIKALRTGEQQTKP